MSQAPHEPPASVPVASAKEAVRALLDELPDDTTLEEIQYRLYVRELVSDRAKIDRTKLLTPQEAEQRMARWLGR